MEEQGGEFRQLRSRSLVAFTVMAVVARILNFGTLFFVEMEGAVAVPAGFPLACTGCDGVDGAPLLEETSLLAMRGG